MTYKIMTQDDMCYPIALAHDQWESAEDAEKDARIMFPDFPYLWVEED